MRALWIAATLALLTAPASAQNLTLRAPAWAQPLLSADVAPTNGGRLTLVDDSITFAARVTIAPLEGGVARVIRFEAHGDDSVLALRRFTGHQGTGWWLWGPDTPHVTHPAAAVRDEFAGLIREAIAGTTLATLNAPASAPSCGDGEEAFVEMAVGSQAISATRACLNGSDAVTRLAQRLSAVAGSRNEEELHAAALQEVMDADRAFAAFAQEHGVPAAFAHYAAQDATLMRGGNPIQGADAVTAAYAHWPQGARLEWAPAGGSVSERGDLGWTWGRYTFTPASGAADHGQYITIWKRDDEGNWRFAFDSSLASPAPARAAAPYPASPAHH